ncbi:MAG: carboxypeptidase-like regulatory domain-containing protein [Terracidiphilus sp.]
MTFGRARLLAGTVFVALAAGLVPAGSRNGGLVGAPAAMAQNLGQRIVEGRVIDANSPAVSGATVFLQNLKSKSIRSYTSESDGKFRFTQVNMADDYDLWAEKGSRKSATKSISSWDSRIDIQCELRLK